VDLDVGDTQFVREQLHGVLEDLIHGHVPALGGMAPGHGQKAPHDAHAPLRGPADVLRARPGTVVGSRGRKQGDVPQDHGQRAVELVRDARQEVAHRRELLRLEELMRAFSNLRLEVLVLAPELPVEEAHREQVVDAEEQLDPVEGLRHEIARAGRERATLGLGCGVGGEDEDRQIDLPRGLPLEPLEDLHAVEMRHPEVQHDQIGPELSVARRHLARVRRTAQVGIAGTLEQLFQQAHHRRLVVHDHDPRAAECLRDHYSSAIRTTKRTRATGELLPKPIIEPTSCMGWRLAPGERATARTRSVVA